MKHNGTKEMISKLLFFSGILPAFSIITQKYFPSVKVFAYHQVIGDKVHSNHSDLTGAIAALEFEMQVRYLCSRYRVISMQEFLGLLEAHEIPENAVMLTFDDGYRNIYEYAFPVLKRYALPATVFCTGNALLDDTVWCDELLDLLLASKDPNVELNGTIYRVNSRNDRIDVFQRLVSQLQREDFRTRQERMTELRKSLGDWAQNNTKRYLGRAEILEMQENRIIFGAHTMSHPLLGSIQDSRELEREINGSIDTLEEITGQKCSCFAYPFGDEGSFSKPCIRILKERGIKAAFTTHRGGYRPGIDPFQLGRFIVRKNAPYFFRMQLSGVLDG
jgi:peptidoglycan/xylan/chitin deacetylase (PgdA/CDA1 family)